MLNMLKITEIKGILWYKLGNYGVMPTSKDSLEIAWNLDAIPNNLSNYHTVINSLPLLLSGQINQN